VNVKLLYQDARCNDKDNIQPSLIPTIYVTSWSTHKFTMGSKVQPSESNGDNVNYLLQIVICCTHQLNL